MKARSGIGITELPDYILEVGSDYVVVNIENCFGTVAPAKITRDDLRRYFATEALDMSSGCRTLGRVVGDWRNIDRLAQIVDSILCS